MDNDPLADFDKRSEEPLHPDLVPWLETTGRFPVLKHPLVFAVPYHDKLAYMLNDQYAYKSEAIEKSLEDGAWGTYVFLHERPYREHAFLEIGDSLSDEEYWDLLHDIWTDTENLWQWESIADLLEDPERTEARHLFMTEEARASLAEMDDVLTIYRGYARDGLDEGWSWTLDEGKAHWFARRLAVDGQVPRVAVATVDKVDVIAYITDRGEEEIVVDPYMVDVTMIVEARRGG